MPACPALGPSSMSPAFQSLKRDRKTNKLVFVPSGSVSVPAPKRGSRAVSEASEGSCRRVAPKPHGHNVMQRNGPLSGAHRTTPSSIGRQAFSTAVLSHQRRPSTRKTSPCIGTCQKTFPANITSEVQVQTAQESASAVISDATASDDTPKHVGVAAGNDGKSADLCSASGEDVPAVEAQVEQSIQIFITPPDDADVSQNEAEAEAAAKEAVHDATLRALEGHRVEETDSLYDQSEETLVDDWSQEDDGSAAYTAPPPSIADAPSVYSQQTQTSEELRIRQPEAALPRPVSPAHTAVELPAHRAFRYVSSVEEPVLQKLPYDRYIAVATHPCEDYEEPSAMLCGRLRLCSKIETSMAHSTLDGVPEHWKMFAGS